MQALSHGEAVGLFLGVGTLTGVACLCGGAARRLRLPAVVGEVLAGILLGPGVLGALYPAAGELLFPRAGPGAFAFDAIVLLCLALYLLLAGMEVRPERLRGRVRAVFLVAVPAFAVPFAAGYAAGVLAPGFFGGEGSPHFGLLLGTLLSISALPVISRTLSDLGILGRPLGALITTAALLNDIAGWIAFSLILPVMPGAGGYWGAIFSPLAAVGGVLAAGRGLCFLLARRSAAGRPASGEIRLASVLALGCLSAALLQAAGSHAALGAFLAGAAVAHDRELAGEVRASLQGFVAVVAAPLFLGRIGLLADFTSGFAWKIASALFVLACAGKIGGCLAGAFAARTAPRKAWAIAFGMNARGAMEIILALLAYQNGWIGPSLFSATVLIALVTSLLAGPAIQFVLARPAAAAKRAGADRRAIAGGKNIAAAELPLL